jgi:hypothetical protein
VGPMSGLCQVIIKNTNAFKESASFASINRSQSLLTTNRIPVLAPSRADRIRLETLLADVWTKEILPFPGMTGRARNEHLVRASASSMMRKLSVASIASNFTKRSGSMASLHRTAEDDESGEAKVLKGTPARNENNSSESSQYKGLDDLTRSRLSVIQDEKENIQQRDSFETPRSLSPAANGSPASTLRRLATLKVKKSWGPDGQRMITPPPRTSSANSVSQSRVTSLSTVTDLGTEEKENIPQVQSAQTAATPQKQGKKAKGIGMSRAVVAEGIRNLFR